MGRIAKWIRDRRLLAEDIEPLCNDIFKFNDIKAIFAENMTLRDRIAIIEKSWGEMIYSYQYKYTPFDQASLRKTIVKITRVDIKIKELSGVLDHVLCW